jgi:hypothetical protein
VSDAPIKGECRDPDQSPAMRRLCEFIDEKFAELHKQIRDLEYKVSGVIEKRNEGKY